MGENKILLGAIWAVLFYILVNGLADNPKEVQRFRQQMNSFVDNVTERVKRVF